MWTKQKQKSIEQFIVERKQRQWQRNRVKEMLREEDNQSQEAVKGEGR